MGKYNKKMFCFLGQLLLWLLFTGNALANTTINNNWTTKTVNDLKQIHDLLVKNTMQYVDKYPPFVQWLSTGLQKSISLAKKSNTKAGYYYALAHYANGFNNGHIAAFGGQLPYRYGGMLLKYQNGKYLVKYSNPQNKNLPPLNAQLISCEHKPAQIIIEREIIPFSFSSHKLEASYNRAANYLFFDANPFRNYLKICSFKAKGETKIYKIKWNVLSWNQAVKIKTFFAHKYPFRIQTFGEKGLWISIPTLSFNGSQDLFFKSLLQIASSFRKYDPIVLDVRGNGGGNSDWAYQLLTKIYGKAFVVKTIKQHDHSYAIYRLSEKNIKRIEYVYQRYPNYIPFATRLKKYYQEGKKISGPMRDQIILPNMQVKKESLPAKSLFHNHIYFLTDNHCFSSCLDFADYIYWLPNTTHIGLSTNADSVYTENTPLKLSHGANFIYPIKVFRNRPRKTNVPYIPKYRYNGDISNTEALMKWVVQLYKQRQF